MSWTPLTAQGSTAGVIDLSQLQGRLCSVDVPGRLEGKGDSVVAALGGLRKICESFEAPRDVPLILRWSPFDPYSKFVPARTYKSASLLLRMRTYKSGRKEVRVEGIIMQAFRFTALADYCLAPPDACRFPRDVVGDLENLRSYSGLDAPRGRGDAESVAGTGVQLSQAAVEADPLSVFMAPPVYTRQFHPFPYKYQDNVFTASAKYFLLPTGDAKQRLENQDLFNAESILGHLKDEGVTTKAVVGPSQPFRPLERGIAGPFNTIARFDDPELPTAATAVTARSSCDEGLLKEVTSLLEQRPLWQRVSLLDQLTKHVTIWKIKPILARTCFLYVDGPWRGCLCRFGYNPRLDPEARKYQTLDFRDPYFRSVGWKTQQAVTTALPLDESSISTPHLNLDNGRRSAPSSTQNRPGCSANTTDWHFREPPTRPSHFFQLCDIDDAGIQSIIKKAPVESECKRASGWFHKDVLSRIRDLMAAKARIMRGVASRK